LARDYGFLLEELKIAVSLAIYKYYFRFADVGLINFGVTFE
jgi:hypothetical protein